MTRVLITGATGFIGSHCLNALIAGDRFEIHAVNRSGQDPGADRVTWHRTDLRVPAQAARLIETVRPTHVLHGAWVATPGIYAQSPENIDWLQGSLALIHGFALNGGVRFVGIGSSAEYDPGASPCIEDETPLRPASIYSKCKLACWLALDAAAQAHGFSAAWGRLFLPYGPGDPPQRLIPAVMANLEAGKPMALSHGNQMRDFVYAPDAADLLVKLLWSKAAGAFNIGTGEGASLRSVIEFLADRLGNKDCLRFGALPPRPGEPDVLVADLRKVTRELGWAPGLPLRRRLEILTQGMTTAL